MSLLRTIATNHTAASMSLRTQHMIPIMCQSSSNATIGAFSRAFSRDTSRQAGRFNNNNNNIQFHLPAFHFNSGRSQKNQTRPQHTHNNKIINSDITMDIVITVQDHATEKNQTTLSPVGQKIVETLGLSYLVENLSPKSSATQCRLYVVPPVQQAQLHDLIKQTSSINSTEDNTAAINEISRVKRIVFVHVGKQQNNNDSDNKDNNNKLPGLTLREQYAYDDAQMDKRDLVRKRISAAYNALYQDNKRDTKLVAVDADESVFGQEIMESLLLQSWSFRLFDQDAVDQWKREKNKDAEVDEFYKPRFALLQSNQNAVNRGAVYADMQNYAKTLAETPANHLNPTMFADEIKERFESLQHDKVKVTVRDQQWAKEMGMNSFLCVAQGSEEEPKFVEVEYRGGNNTDVIDLFLVGKGVCFDSGGISIKPGENMKEMKGDMGGAASVLAALLGAVKLGVPLNINVVVVLVENMPSGRAVKPGDVVRARNKVSIEVDNTDAEGRLILADALVYASEKSPKVLIDVATLTGAVIIGLGHPVSAAYTNTRNLWSVIEEAGVRTNDYFWRMPLHIEPYKAQLKSRVADLNNIGGRAAGSATAATFLSEFVDFEKVREWGHLDIAGSSMKDGMTGRPTRALIQLAELLADKKE